MPKFDIDNLFEYFVILCVCVLMGTCTYKEARDMLSEPSTQESK